MESLQEKEKVEKEKVNEPAKAVMFVQHTVNSGLA